MSNIYEISRAILIFYKSVFVFLFFNCVIQINQFNLSKSLNVLLNPYLYTSLILSSSSVICFILVYFNWVEVADWDIVNELIGVKDSQYRFPYYLSMVNVELSESRYLFGEKLSMFSSWSREPQLFVLFSAPSLFLLKNSNFKYQKIPKFIIIGSILISGSLTGFIILLLAFLIKIKFSVAIYSITAISLFILIFKDALVINSSDILNKLSFDSHDLHVRTFEKIFSIDGLFGHSIFGIISNSYDFKSGLISLIMLTLLLSYFIITFVISYRFYKKISILFPLMVIFIFAFKNLFALTIYNFPYLILISTILYEIYKKNKVTVHND